MKTLPQSSPPKRAPAHRQPVKLARKLLILGALPAVLMFAALMLFFTYVRLQDANERVAEHSQIVADSLAPALEYAVVSGNTSVLNDIISESLRRSHADWIRVTSVRGDVLGFVSNANADARARKQADVEARLKTRAAPALDKNIYTAEILQKPLNMNDLDIPEWFDPGLSFVGGALRVGNVYVGVDPDLLASKRRGIVWTSLGLSATLLLLTMLLVNYFLTGILRPMRNIALRIKVLSHHDYKLTPVNQYRNSQELITIEMRLNELAQHLQEQQELQEQTLTQTRSALEQAERNSQAKSEFMDIASHELQTPLQAVLGMVKLLEHESLSSSQSEYLTTASRSAQDLLLVINDILEYSRLDGGTAVLRSYQFDLQQLIHNCVASHGQAALEAELTLDLSFHPGFPDMAMVHGDAPKLRQILAGLLDNSIKGSHDGKVQIEACLKTADTAQLLDHRGADDQLPATVLLSVAVSDTAAQELSHSLGADLDDFDEFDNVNQNNVSGNTGLMGLSLPLVQRLIELMGGQLKVEVNADGHSVLRFEIPFER
jgi:signal transduction histidine kinase